MKVIEIAKREFMDNVLSWKFLIAFVLATLIMSTSVVMLSDAYKEDVQNYNARQQEYEARAEQDEYYWAKMQAETHRVAAKPNPLAIFVGGTADRLGLGPWLEYLIVDEGSVSSAESPMTSRFDVLDLSFVAVGVMSLMAVIFSYDAISGEKERGTLKLVLANPVPRDSVILGKYLGGMASVLLPFAMSLLIAFAILQWKGVSLRPDDYARMGVILLVFVLTVSAFFLVGLAVSSLTKRSNVSLLTLLLVWLVLVYGVGNVAAVTARETSDVWSQRDMQARYQAIEQKYDLMREDLQEQIQEMHDKRRRDHNNWTEEDQARLDALYDQQNSLWEEQSKEREGVREEYMRQLDSQLRRAETIAVVSPAESFRTTAESVAGSDYWTVKERGEEIETYRERVEDLYEQWREENRGGHDVIIMESSGRRTMSATVAQDGDAMPTEPQEEPEPFQPPPFNYEGKSLSASVKAVNRDLIALVAYNVIGFLVAYVAFLRYDVR